MKDILNAIWQQSGKRQGRSSLMLMTIRGIQMSHNLSLAREESNGNLFALVYELIDKKMIVSLNYDSQKKTNWREKTVSDGLK